MMSLSSVVEPLRAANRLSSLPLFNWKIVSTDGKAIRLTCGIEIQVDNELTSNDSGELFIVIAGFNHDRHISINQLSILRQIAPKFKTLFCIEAGTWILARAGLIDHHTVTTHWEDTEKLAERYPSLDIRNDRYIIDGNVWSSGGASPTLDMMLHYIRTTQNKSLAIDVASVFIYDDQLSATDAQTISLGRIEQTEPRLARAIHLMENNLEEPFSTMEIAQHIGISVRMLEILSKKHLGVTPGSYYLRLRLQTARRMVLDSNLSILEIAVRSGFKSQSALSRAFMNQYGKSPLKLRNSSF
ncbi:MAG: GlxA family transcriptional regulator [Arenicella sp.]